MEVFRNIVNACNYHELPKNTPVVNKLQFEPYIWISIASARKKHLIVYEICEILEDNTKDTSNQITKYTCDKCKPWIQIQSEYMNTKVGYHLYRIGFIDPVTDDICYMFFSYIIQDDNPDKPYIYMKRD